jgi:dihydropteroate synthase
VVDSVTAYLIERGSWARAAGLTPDRIIVDAGLDLGKTADQSLTLLRASDRLAGLGYPLLLSASNKTFLGKILDLEIDERWAASMAATALGAALGCRIMRVHDVAAHRQVCSVMAAIGAAGRAPVAPVVRTGP